MRPGVDFAQGPDRDFGVNLRGVQSGVPEQLLDQADVRAVLKHVGGAAVAEQVTTAALANVGRLDRFRHPVAGAGPAHALPQQ